MYLGPLLPHSTVLQLVGVRGEPHRWALSACVPDGSELLRQRPREKGAATTCPAPVASRLPDYETATISYILTPTDEQFLVQVNC